MNEDTLLEHLENFRVKYPQFLKENYINGFEDDEIKSSILEVYLEIPIYCKNYNKILYLLTLHNLIVNRDSTKDPENINDIEINEYKQVATGDISTTFKDNEKASKDYDPLLYRTKFGYEAKQLLKKCARGRVGVIR